MVASASRTLNNISCSSLLNSFAESYGDYQGAVYVRNYEGDTITFNLPCLHPIIEEKIFIRVNGVDTPEIREKFKKEKYDAKQAKQMVANILKLAEQVAVKNMESLSLKESIAKLV